MELRLGLNNTNLLLCSFHGARCWWRSWLRRCATSRKVAGSIPRWCRNPSGRTMAVGPTQPQTEMSTRNISWGVKGGRCVGLISLPHLYVPIFLKSESLKFLEPSGPLQASLGIAFTQRFYPLNYYCLYTGHMILKFINCKSRTIPKVKGHNFLTQHQAIGIYN